MNSGDQLWFPASQLAALAAAHVIKFPRDEKNARIKARKLGWKNKEVECQGGKGGVRTEFLPPQDMQYEISYFLEKNPDFFIQIKMMKKGETPQKTYPVTTERAPQLTASSNNHGYHVTQRYSGNDNRVNNYLTLPKHVLQTRPDQSIQSDQVVDYLAFDKEWLGESLNIYNSLLALIKIKDDNMEPTLAKDDLILTQLNQGEVDGDSIYVLKFGNTLTLRRIQRKANGSLLVFSDNKKYEREEYDSDKDIPVVGKVVWYGRRI
jgi:SOS-response transcriptional repressor LexA